MFGSVVAYIIKNIAGLNLDQLFQNKIKATIYIDNRQTGSNIARIIYVEKEVQALNLELFYYYLYHVIVLSLFSSH